MLPAMPPILMRVKKRATSANGSLPNLGGSREPPGVRQSLNTSADATDSNWHRRRRCFGGYDVGATEAG